MDIAQIEQTVESERGKGISFRAISTENASYYGVALGIDRERIPDKTLRDELKHSFESGGFKWIGGTHLALKAATEADARQAARRMNNPDLSLAAVIELQQQKMRLRKKLVELAATVTDEQREQKHAIDLRVQEEYDWRDYEPMEFHRMKRTGFRENRVKQKATDPRLAGIAASCESPELQAFGIALGLNKQQSDDLAALDFTSIAQSEAQLTLSANALRTAMEVQDREREILKVETGHALKKGEPVANDPVNAPSGKKPSNKLEIPACTEGYLEALEKSESRGRIPGGR